MRHCPDDDMLQRFIANVTPPPEASAIESHLEECERCRLRLDVLADVTSVGAVLARAATESRVDSVLLQRSIEQLQHEATSLLDTPSQLGTNRTTAAGLPLLQPSDRDGFIGKLGNLEIRRVIGRGGMGVVYEGLDPVLHRTVAVKVLSPHLLGNDEAKERFLREARAAATLTHEHIVTIHAIDQFDGMPYLVLQHVDGESLADVLNRMGRLPVGEAARMGAQVARGLAAAHANGLIHRDIKPANLLLERDSRQVRITDFGLVKSAGGESITGVGMIAGTPTYMSPEQTHGHEVDARSDLFSLGVVLYEMATGRLPFSGDSPFIILSRIRDEAAKPLTYYDPTLPRWFCSIVDRLLAKDPDRRIQSAMEVAELLESQQATRAAPRRAKKFALVGLAALVGITAIVGAIVLTREPEPTPTPQVPPTVPEVAIVGRDGRFKTLAEAVQASADGDILEVHGDGPHPSPKIEIRGKRLTIRAAEGSRPVFQPETTGASTQWIVTDRELTLTDLDADWPGIGKAIDGELNGEEAVVMTRGRATLTRCRILCGNRTSCVACGGALTVNQCYFVTDRTGGRCIAWRATAPLIVTQSALEGRFGIILSTGTEPTSARVEITDCTFRTDTAFTVFKPALFPTPVPITARRCVFDCERLAVLCYAPVFPNGRRPTITEMRTALSKSALWSESENVYRRKMAYLSSMTFQRPVNAADWNSLTDWPKFWNQTDTKSIEGDIQFHPRPLGARLVPPRLGAIKDPSGPIPQSVGANQFWTGD